MPVPTSLIRPALIAILVAGLGAALINHWLDPQAMTAYLADHRDVAALAFLAYHLVGTLFFVPRTLLGIAAGALFGFWWGLTLSLAGATLGAIAAFWAARLINGGWFDPASVPGLGRWMARAEGTGFRAVLLMRLLPMHGAVVNYALGLTRLSTWDYTLGTVLGILPAAIITTNLGASGADLLGGDGGLLALIGWIGALVALSLGGAWIVRHRFQD